MYKPINCVSYCQRSVEIRDCIIHSIGNAVLTISRTLMNFVYLLEIDSGFI